MRYLISIASLFLLAGCDPDEPTSQNVPAKQSSNVEKKFIVLTAPPEPLLDKMFLLYSPDNAEWPQLVDEFIENGHPILPYLIHKLQKDKKLSPESAEQISKRIDQSPAVTIDAQRILTLMEIACYADVMCHKMEYPVRKSTLDYVKSNIDSQGTREVLHWIRTSYQSGLPLDFPGDDTGEFHGALVKAMKARLVGYANQLLAPPTPQQDSK